MRVTTAVTSIITRGETENLVVFVIQNAVWGADITITGYDVQRSTEMGL